MARSYWPMGGERPEEFGRIIGELDPEAARIRDETLRAQLERGEAETIRQRFIPDLTTGDHRPQSAGTRGRRPIRSAEYPAPRPPGPIATSSGRRTMRRS